MREGLALLVRLHRDLQLVGVAATAVDAVWIFAEQQPDVTVLDLDLPSHAAAATIREIRARDPDACVIGLATFGPGATWAEGLAAGTCQCIAKGSLGDMLPCLIRAGGQRGRPSP
jgi:DNA-binding NarL/FixJ family response regulator